MEAAARRPRRSRAQWQRLMADYEASGQSQQVFCREHRLALGTFARWRRALSPAGAGYWQRRGWPRWASRMLSRTACSPS